MGKDFIDNNEKNLIDKIVDTVKTLETLEEILEERNDIVWRFLMAMEQKKLAVLFIASTLNRD